MVKQGNQVRIRSFVVDYKTRIHGDLTIRQDAVPVSEVLDTTGAGDAYTAAFLYGYTQGRSLEECAKLGTWCGAQVIQQLGARLEKDVLADYPFDI